MTDKRCTKCGAVKPLPVFKLDKRNGKRVNTCNQCRGLQNKLNRDPVKQKAYQREYYLKNRQKRINRARERSDKERRATPLWVKWWSIQELREKARKETKATGVQHHIDHIIPIDHPLVCGLNVPWNIRVVTADINLSKQNTWEPWWL